MGLLHVEERLAKAELARARSATPSASAGLHRPRQPNLSDLPRPRFRIWLVGGWRDSAWSVSSGIGLPSRGRERLRRCHRSRLVRIPLVSAGRRRGELLDAEPLGRPLWRPAPGRASSLQAPSAVQPHRRRRSSSIRTYWTSEFNKSTPSNIQCHDSPGLLPTPRSLST